MHPGFGIYLVVPMQPRQLQTAWFPPRSTPLTSSFHALPTLALTLTKLSHFWHRLCILLSHNGRVADYGQHRHSIAASKIINPSIAGAPFDTTPDMFDTQFYLEELLRSRGFHGDALQRGQADSPIEGEMRIMSDYLIARGGYFFKPCSVACAYITLPLQLDSRTSCTWQSFINNQARMAESFANAMAKLSVLGQDTSKMIDCSEVIPVPKSLPIEHQCVYPAGFSQADVEQAVLYSFIDVNIVTDD